MSRSLLNHAKRASLVSAVRAVFVCFLIEPAHTTYALASLGTTKRVTELIITGALPA